MQRFYDAYLFIVGLAIVALFSILFLTLYGKTKITVGKQIDCECSFAVVPETAEST